MLYTILCVLNGIFSRVDYCTMLTQFSHFRKGGSLTHKLSNQLIKWPRQCTYWGNWGGTERESLKRNAIQKMRWKKMSLKANQLGLTSSNMRSQLTIGFYLLCRFRYFLALLSFSGIIHMMGYLNLPSIVYLIGFFVLICWREYVCRH